MRLLVFILWLLLGLVYWYLSGTCCTENIVVGEATEITDSLEIKEDTVVSESQDDDPAASSQITSDTESGQAVDQEGDETESGIETGTLTKPGKVIEKLTPIAFIKSSAEPVIDDSWTAFRDSLTEMLGQDQVLQVEGKYFDDESRENDSDLGLARARNVLNLFGDLPEDRSELRSGSAGAEFTKDQANNLIAFRFLKRTKTIKEVDDRTLIYFPYNSTNKISDSELEQYLVDVAERLKQTRERVKLIGHTDSFGNEASNQLLGLWRAEVIRDYLVSKGLSANRINVSSEGESNPIAPNNTDSGRSKNRRVEIQIIN